MINKIKAEFQTPQKVKSELSKSCKVQSGETLSDKRGVINLDENRKEMYAYHEKDVREFIQKLKEDFRLMQERRYKRIPSIIKEFEYLIDKLAGLKLVKGGNEENGKRNM